MRRPLIILLPALAVLAMAGPVRAQVTALDAAASALRTTSVYVDPAAERAGQVDQDRLRALVRRGDTPIFVAVLPAAAAADAGGDVNRLPTVLAGRVGLRGTYAIVAGSSFRAGSNVLPAGQARSLATASFEARLADGVGAVLETFVERVNAAAPAGAGNGAAGAPAASSEGGSGGGGSGGALLLLLAAAGGGFYVWTRRRTRRRRAEERKEMEAERGLLQAELSVLGADVLELEPTVTMHPDARPDYDAGVTRYQTGRAALESADERVDLVRVRRVVDEGRYAMARARAVVDGRPVPPPPDQLAGPGRHGEPPLELDEQGAPVYAGYGGMPWYGGGGWFGGGSGLLTGLMLGQMLGGGFGGWGHHGGHGGDGGGGGDNGAGGDSGAGGGDWGGGDFGGGDFGGGDFGGGDFGGGGDF